MLQNFALILSVSIARCANGFPETRLRFKGRFLMTGKISLKQFTNRRVRTVDSLTAKQPSWVASFDSIVRNYTAREGVHHRRNAHGTVLL
jgi:hypothetical protein